MSLMPYFSMVMRSIPIPKAKPVYFLLSMLQASRTFGSTIPQPRISSQPVYLQTLQPSPPQIEQLTSISADGSVNGKYEGRKRICDFSPKSSRAKYSKVCFRSANDTFSSTYKPSIWWKMQCERAEMASLRNTRPGKMARMGGCVFYITRICTLEVCVRSNTSGSFSMKKVSCISRAGCSGGKFNAENTCQSSSIS